MVSDDFVYGICSDCGHAYTEPIDSFEFWIPPGCPACGSRREPYPVQEKELPGPPDLIPLSPEASFEAPKTVVLLLLVKDMGYRLGVWLDRVENSTYRYFALGGENGTGKMTIPEDSILAAWRVGDRPGHHG